jgi:hypothetical protein
MEEDSVNEGSLASGFAQSPHQKKPRTSTRTRTSTIEERMGEVVLNEAAARSSIARNANNEVVIGIMAGL